MLRSCNLQWKPLKRENGENEQMPCLQAQLLYHIFHKVLFLTDNILKVFKRREKSALKAPLLCLYSAAYIS